MDAQLKFTITDQTIKRTDTFKPVSDSRDYLYAGFTFNTHEWDNQIKTAVFYRDDEETGYPVVLSQNDTCLVPWEVLVSPVRFIYVSVFAGYLITSNKASVLVRAAGYSTEIIEPSTPSVYDQILTRLQELEDYVDERVDNIDGGLFTDWNDN